MPCGFSNLLYYGGSHACLTKDAFSILVSDAVIGTFLRAKTSGLCVTNNDVLYAQPSLLTLYTRDPYGINQTHMLVQRPYALYI